MRIKISKKEFHLFGSVRQVNIFTWWPLVLDGEMIWLEKIEVVQRRQIGEWETLYEVVD